MTGAAVTVAAVDDHEAIREGVHARLGRCEGVEVVAEAATVPELLDTLDRDRAEVDVVLLDLMLGDGSTPGENVRPLLDRGSRVIVYSSLAPTADLRRRSPPGRWAPSARLSPCPTCWRRSCRRPAGSRC
ncbi:MAG: response regulator [Kineosporiaceae bacterium]